MSTKGEAPMTPFEAFESDLLAYLAAQPRGDATPAMAARLLGHFETMLRRSDAQKKRIAQLIVLSFTDLEIATRLLGIFIEDLRHKARHASRKPGGVQ